MAERVINLFTEKDESRAAEMAAQLSELNGDRQLARAKDPRRNLRFRSTRLLSGKTPIRSSSLDDTWHRGVIGICATRVVERYHRPALVFSCENGEAHGSGRSIEAFHLLNALESFPEIFTRFGGHSHAVGCALPVERLPELRSKLDAYARQALTPEDFIPVLDYDSELALDDVDQQLWETLTELEPFGAGNPRPTFVVRGVKLVQPPRILKEIHLKLRVKGSSPRPREVVGWRMAAQSQREALLLGDVLDLAFTVDFSTHPDFGGVQMTLADFNRTGGHPM